MLNKITRLWDKESQAYPIKTHSKNTLFSTITWSCIPVLFVSLGYFETKINLKFGRSTIYRYKEFDIIMENKYKEI
jgi:hypothetical protein